MCCWRSFILFSVRIPHTILAALWYLWFTLKRINFFCATHRPLPEPWTVEARASLCLCLCDFVNGFRSAICQQIKNSKHNKKYCHEIKFYLFRLTSRGILWWKRASATLIICHRYGILFRIIISGCSLRIALRAARVTSLDAFGFDD